MYAARTQVEAQYSSPSDRVKMVDMHPKEPIFIGALYSGTINLWNYETHTLVRSFDTGSGVPVRCARFVPQLQSFVCGADDMMLRVYNYNTMERTKIFQAHDDYVRCIAVHEQLPIVLTCSDDMTVRQWDWSKDWALQMTYEGHIDLCLAVVFNPKNPSTFASASLDRTIKVWNLNNPEPNFELDGHDDCVNCIEFYPRGDKPYLLSGSDDTTVRLWDYQTKACLQVFTFHSKNITAVLFHPDQPLIFTVAEDHSMKVISSETFRLLQSVDHTTMERAWSMAARRCTNVLVVGFDHGVTVYKVGDDRPVYSLESATGRVLLATRNEITRVDVKGVAEDIPDGEVLSVTRKDLGTVEANAQAVAYGPGGQYIAVQGQNEYTILSALSMRPKSYGQCISFIWGPEKNSYAVLESISTLKIFRHLRESETLTLTDTAERLLPGPLFAVQCRHDIVFYDWTTLAAIRRIDGRPTSIEWNATGELVALAMDSAIFTLRYNKDAVTAYLDEHDGKVGRDGLDFAFEPVDEIEEQAREMSWVGDCLLFVDASHRLNYYIGGELSNLAVLTRNQYLLGYLPKESRIVCIDTEGHITSYTFKANVIDYMTAILHEDWATAAQILPSVDAKSRYRLAQFLQSKGLLELALEVTTDEELRFELAVALKRLPVAQAILASAPSPARWKQVGDLALEQGFFDVAIEALQKCNDFSGLLLVYSALDDTAALARLGRAALQEGKANVAFTCLHLTGHHTECAELLAKTGKFAEAALYARTYCPTAMEDLVARWKVSLTAMPRFRDALASPRAHPELFPSLQEAMREAETATRTAEVHDAPTEVPSHASSVPQVGEGRAASDDRRDMAQPVTLTRTDDVAARADDVVQPSDKSQHVAEPSARVVSEKPNGGHHGVATPPRVDEPAPHGTARVSDEDDEGAEAADESVEEELELEDEWGH